MMMDLLRLHKIELIHFGPKSSEEGVLTYAIAYSEEAVLTWIKENRILSWNYWEEGEEGTILPEGSWWDKNPDAISRAKNLGLEVFPPGSVYLESAYVKGLKTQVKGLKTQLLRWWRGDFEEVTDTYYGITQYYWDVGSVISPQEAEILIKYKIAIDLRDFNRR